MTRQAEFEKAVQDARRYEEALSLWLQMRYGFHVLPTYDYSGLGAKKAPKLVCGQSGLVIPDLMAFRKGKALWMECKFKTKADWNRNMQRMVTGIDYRLYDHYRQVEVVSGCPVYLAFLHSEEDEVRIERLSVLAAKENHRYPKDKPQMVYWRYCEDVLPLKGHLSDIMKTCIHASV